MVSKATYTAWEAEVIAAFFTAEKPRTALIPVDGAPAVLSKEKFVLAVVPAGAAEAVAAGEAAGLAASQHVAHRQAEGGRRAPRPREACVWRHGVPPCGRVDDARLRQSTRRATSAG